MQTAIPLFSSVNQNLAGLKPARFLPTSRAEMEALGWDQCDVIIVTGDAYVDHPTFGIPCLGRWLQRRFYGFLDSVVTDFGGALARRRFAFDN